VARVVLGQGHDATSRAGHGHHTLAHAHHDAALNGLGHFKLIRRRPRA
jgi:hypothetical protein